MDLTGIDCGNCPRVCPPSHAAGCVMSELQERIQVLIGPKAAVLPCGTQSLNIQQRSEVKNLTDSGALVEGVETYAEKFFGPDSLLIQMTPEQEREHLIHTHARILHFAETEGMSEELKLRTIRGKSGEHILQQILLFFTHNQALNHGNPMKLLTREEHFVLPRGSQKRDQNYWFNFTSPYNSEIKGDRRTATEADTLTEIQAGKDTPRKLLLWDVTTGVDEMLDKLTNGYKTLMDFTADMKKRGLQVDRVSVLLQHPNAPSGLMREMASDGNYAMFLPLMPQVELLTKRIEQALKTFTPTKDLTPSRRDPSKDPTHRRHSSSPSKQYRSSGQY
jgi:hypothetical protein